MSRFTRGLTILTLVLALPCGAQNRVTQPQCLRLRHVYPRYGIRNDSGDPLQQFGLASGSELGLKFERRVEMIGNGVLRAAGNEHQGFNAGFQRLLHRILDQRLVDDGQHLFRNGLGRRQEPGAQPRNRKNGLPDRFDGLRHWLGTSRGHTARLMETTSAAPGLVLIDVLASSGTSRNRMSLSFPVS